jgi:hypothetical protein
LEVCFITDNKYKPSKRDEEEKERTEKKHEENKHTMISGKNPCEK